MKRILGFALVAITILFQSCTLEQTKTDQICRGWKVNKYYRDNQDMTAFWNSTYQNYSLIFSKDGNFNETSVVLGISVGRSGIWEFKDNFATLYRKFNDDQSIQNFQIILLSKSNLNVRINGSVMEDFILIPL